jgi:Methyltransferase domain
LRIRLPQPWSRWIARAAYLPRLAVGDAATRRELAEEPRIERLARGHEALQEIGAGFSERVVEIPWAMRRLALRGARVLDIGTTFSPTVYKRLLVRRPQRVVVADLAEAGIPGMESHLADVRRLPFAADSFDVAVCISTLEHVGVESSRYESDGHEVQGDHEPDVTALRELGRVAPTVLVTVPAGRDLDMGWQRQYSPARFREVVARAGLTIAQLDLFAHDPRRGWASVEEEAIAQRTYGEGAVAAAASLCAELVRR